MKPFENFLAQKMGEYITYRQSLGYTIQNLRSCLPRFDRYLKQTEADWDSLQPSFFLNFRESIKGESSMIMVIMGRPPVSPHKYINQGNLQSGQKGGF